MFLPRRPPTGHLMKGQFGQPMEVDELYGYVEKTTRQSFNTDESFLVSYL